MEYLAANPWLYSLLFLGLGIGLGVLAAEKTEILGMFREPGNEKKYSFTRVSGFLTLMALLVKSLMTTGGTGPPEIGWSWVTLVALLYGFNKFAGKIMDLLMLKAGKQPTT